MTRKDLILNELKQAQSGKIYDYYGKCIIGEGWCPNYRLADVSIGAISWRTRVSDLRNKDGYPIEKKRLVLPNGTNTNTWLYRLKQGQMSIEYPSKQEKIVVA